MIVHDSRPILPPITAVDRYHVGGGRIGPLTRKIRQILQEVIRRRLPKYKHRLTLAY